MCHLHCLAFPDTFPLPPQEKLLDLFGDVFEVHDTVFVMDATAPGSAAVRALKQYLADCKAKVTQVSCGPVC